MPNKKADETDYRFENDPYLRPRTEQEDAYTTHAAYVSMRNRGVKPEQLLPKYRAAYAKWLKANPQ